MTEYTEQLREIVRRLEALEKSVATTDRSLYGGLGPSVQGRSVEERLSALESVEARAPRLFTHSLEPIVIERQYEPPAGEPMPVTDIEWGVPKEDPGDEPTATITLRPCDKDGVEYENAGDAVVYVRDDRAEVILGTRGWKATEGETTGTVLSFLRFPWNVGSDPAVIGVLIGEGPSDGVAVVEYGHPGGAVSGEKQIVYLIPCEATGEALPPEKQAPSLYCFIRDDQSSADVTERGWNQSSILSFVRSSSVGYVGETKVEGVLIGEGLALGSNKVKTNGDDSTAGYLDDEIVVVDPAAPAAYSWLGKQVVLDPLRGDGNDRQFLLTHTDWDANNLTLGGGLTGELTAGNGAEVVVVLPPPGDPYITFQLFKDAYDEKRHSTVLAQLNEQEGPDIKYIIIPAKVRTDADDTTPGYLDDEIIVDPGGAAPYWLLKAITPGGAANNKLLIEHKDFTEEYAEVTVEDLLVYDSSGNGVTEHNASPGTDDGYNYITFALHEVAADDPGHMSIYPDEEPQALLCLKWLAVPAGTAEGDTLVWDNTALRWIKKAASTCETPYAVLPDETPTTRSEYVDAQTDTWDRANQPTGKDGVDLWLMTRVVFDTGTMHYYWRKLTYDSAGNLKLISAESRSSES